jgi:hypothetical protein
MVKEVSSPPRTSLKVLVAGKLIYYHVQLARTVEYHVVYGFPYSGQASRDAGTNWGRRTDTHDPSILQLAWPD